MDLNEFLVWVVSGGGAVGIASFILERVPAFQKLSSDGRRYVFLASAVVLALGAYAIVQFVPAAALEAAAPWFAVIAGVAGPILVGQGVHLLDPARKDNNPTLPE